MMNKRRIFYLITALVISSAVGCGKSDTNEEAEVGSSNSNSEVSVEASIDSSDSEEATGAESETAPVIADDDFSNLYSEAKECPNAENFEGKWYTGTHSSVSGDMTITDQNEKGFHFAGFFSYYLNSGEAEGDAVFVKDNVAVYKYPEEEDEYLGFVMDGDTMHVVQKGILGMGMNVSAQGEYSQKEPEYVNADIINKAYTESQLSEIKKMIGDDEVYDDYFKFGTEIGAVDYKDTETKTGEKCRVVDCIVPTYGVEYKAVMTDSGKIYLSLNVGGEGDKLYTNDSEYTEKTVPETVEE